MCNFETSYLHFNSIVVTTSRLQFWNQTQYFLRFTRHFAPWCSCLWCGLRLSDFGHKTSHGVPSCHKGKKVRLLFSSWATAPVWVSLFSFSPEALIRLQKNATCWLLSCFLRMARQRLTTGKLSLRSLHGKYCTIKDGSQTYDLIADKQLRVILRYSLSFNWIRRTQTQVKLYMIK